MSDAPDSMLSLEAVAFDVGNTRLHDLSLAIEPGQAVAVLGSRRSGKLDLLQICLGLRPPAGGTVRILGQDLWALNEAERTALRSRVPLIHEQPLFLSNVRLYDNLALPLRYHSHLSENEIRTRVDRAAARVGLERYDAIALPMMCSRELLRRAAYTRALSMSPSLLVVEELGTALDDGARDWTLRVLLEYRREGGAVLYSAPAPLPDEALSDRLVLMDRGEVLAIGEPAELRRSGVLEDWRGRSREEV
jgi:phospholipid/cholesterol/gamma-HCH transport system ATP-binding protein